MTFTSERAREAAAASAAVRSGKAALRRELARGRIDVASAIAHPHAAGELLGTFLLWVPGIGGASMPRLVEAAGLPPSMQTRPVGRLTERQREAILALCP